MDKALARAKHSSSRRGRRRFSRGNRSVSSARSIESQGEASPSAWIGYEDLFPLQEIVDEGPKGKLDYGELLGQEPAILSGEFSTVLSRGLDPFEDAFADLYSFDDPETSTSSFLSLDLEMLGQRLSKVSLKKSLFIDDETTLPFELLVSDEEGSSSSNEKSDDQEKNSETEKVEAMENSEDAREAIEDVREWLDTALRDPDDGKALGFDNPAVEELVPQESKGRDREAELDELLDLLDNVTVNEGGDGGSKLDELIGGGVLGKDSSSFMSQKDIDTLMWSPGDDTKPANPPDVTSSDMEKHGLPPPSMEEDFDAWLDSFE